jgi:hypothetical protein
MALLNRVGRRLSRPGQLAYGAVPMTDDPRRRIRLTRPVKPARRVGEPNVLSDAAVPNRLSTMPERPTGVQVAARPATETWPATGTATPKARMRLPSFGTIIFLGFPAITAFRLFGQFVGGLASPTPTPAIVTPGQPVEPGSIIFGTGSDGACGVTGSDKEFAAGTEVWWSATLSNEQEPDAEVVVIVSRDDVQIEREDVPADASVGTWSVLCSSGPVDAADAGTYRVEVWDVSLKQLHAAGEYRLVAS